MSNLIPAAVTEWIISFQESPDKRERELNSESDPMCHTLAAATTTTTTSNNDNNNNKQLHLYSPRIHPIVYKN